MESYLRVGKRLWRGNQPSRFLKRRISPVGTAKDRESEKRLLMDES